MLPIVAEGRTKDPPKLYFPVVLSPTINDLTKIVPTPTPKPTPEAPRPAKVTPPKKAVSAPKNPTPPAKSSGGNSGRNYSVAEVKALIVGYSAQYGISSEAPLCIAKLESGFNQFSKNKTSSASGVFQYLSGTWKGTDEGKAGLSVFDASANTLAAVKYMASRGNTKPWVVGSKCPLIQTI